VKRIRMTTVNAAVFTSLLLVGHIPAQASSPVDAPTTGPVVTSAQVALRFNDDAGPSGATQSSFTNRGSVQVDISVVSENGGQVTSRESRTGQGDAVTFPRFDSTESAPRAVIRITGSGTSDDLNPGSADFAWGTDFAMDSGPTAEKSSTSHDNGDNLVQRGLYGGTQYKLQLDGDRASCRLSGSTGAAGAVYVAAPVTLSPDVWYRAACKRSGETLKISVREYDSTGEVVGAWYASQTSAVGFGEVTYSSPSIPMSVGGKLDHSGALVTSASDQFNGSLDNVFLRLIP
jgi:hypothetical protein